MKQWKELAVVDCITLCVRLEVIYSYLERGNAKVLKLCVNCFFFILA